MTKIDIFSGFLGAGKTTLIKKLIKEAYAGEKLVLIENEFGEIGIDGGFMKEAGIEVNEMNSGCICCSLVGDFGAALGEVLDRFAPDRILIEPSGVGKLSDVIRAVQELGRSDVSLNSFTTIADALKCRMYMKNFGEFFNNQIEHAGTIVLSRTDGMNEAKLSACIELIRSLNEKATIITTAWDQLDGAQILSAMEKKDTLAEALALLEKEHRDSETCPVCGEHHGHAHHHHDDECECGHHHEHDDECECGHHHEHDDGCECGHHHEHDHECSCGHDHHEHDHECSCGHDHHEHDHECSCGHDHHGHHHHHADEVFASWGKETPKKYTKEQIREILSALEDDRVYGMVLRAKGIVAAQDGSWIHFDYVPGEADVRTGSAEVTGRLCVIGSALQEAAIAQLFGL